MGNNYITLDQVKKLHTEEEVERFLKFMDHQTVPGPDSFYMHDYVRWKSQFMPTEQGEDWD